MLDKKTIEEIDYTIKDIWLKNIRNDYLDEDMINEDCLKDCMYYHMRRRLSSILKKNNLRIYTEYTLPEIKKYRADMVIAQYEPNWEENYSSLRQSIQTEDIVAIVELKFTCGNDVRTQEWVKHDTYKFRDYMHYGRAKCQFYLAVVYETECEYLHWMDKRSTNNWANGYVTELNAGFIDGTIKFGVNSYNNMNSELNIER